LDQLDQNGFWNFLIKVYNKLLYYFLFFSKKKIIDTQKLDQKIHFTFGKRNFFFIFKKFFWQTKKKFAKKFSKKLFAKMKKKFLFPKKKWIRLIQLFDQ
jgi:hypothetical protein